MAETTVHVVDDDESFLMAMSRLLRASGFRRGRIRRRASSWPSVASTSRMRGRRSAHARPRRPRLPGRARAKPIPASGPLPDGPCGHRVDGAGDARRCRGLPREDAAKEVLLDAVCRALSRDRQEREERSHRDELRARFAAISAREREVLDHVLRGRLNKQIAGDLGIHERTVKVHRKSIMTKLSVRSVAALAQLSQEAGLPAHS